MGQFEALIDYYKRREEKTKDLPVWHKGIEYANIEEHEICHHRYQLHAGMMFIAGFWLPDQSGLSARKARQEVIEG